jgi:hypothetical protein
MKTTEYTRLLSCFIREMPTHPVNKKEIAQCEEAIKFIEAATDHPPLRSMSPSRKTDPNN